MSIHANDDCGILLQAFAQAIKGGKSATNRDPVKNVYFNENNVLEHKGLFDFLDTLQSGQDNINTANIQNAATLYALMILGDEMGIFRVADVILKYVTLGKVDVESSTTATRLYNYMKLRDERTTSDERAMFYQQVFSIGEGETMDNMATNKGFGSLWSSLMNEVIRYIKKYERVDNPELVSKFGIKQAVINLQHNLSRAGSGMVKIYIPEMYAHLEDAIRIINADELKDQLGQGVARDVWNVIESISMQEFNYYPNTAALRTIASSARNIILSIADYSEATFDDADFQNLVNNVEAFIIAQGQTEDEYQSDKEDESFEDEFDEKEMETIDEDWDF